MDVQERVEMGWGRSLGLSDDDADGYVVFAYMVDDGGSAIEVSEEVLVVAALS